MNRYHQSTSQFMGKQLPCVRDSDGEIVAAGCTANDAALFAAAPELLNALIMMLNQFQDNEQYDDDDAEVIAAARSALNNALESKQV